MKPKTGYDMCLARNTGDMETPVWSDLDEVGDVSLSGFSMGTAELKRRGNRQTKVLATGLSPPEIEFRLHHGLDATNFDAMRANFLAGKPELFALLNGPSDGTSPDQVEGWHLPCIITEFPWDQALEDVSGHDVKLTLAYMEDDAGDEIEMEWLTIAGYT